MKYSFNKKKILIITLLTALSIGFVSSIILLSVKKEEKEVSFERKDIKELDLSDSIEKADINKLINETSNDFSQDKIEKHLGNLLQNALKNNNTFINDKLNNYKGVIRYQITNFKKTLKINLFLYNKKIKHKNYKSFFQMYIV